MTEKYIEKKRKEIILQIETVTEQAINVLEGLTHKCYCTVHNAEHYLLQKLKINKRRFSWVKNNLIMLREIMFFLVNHEFSFLHLDFSFCAFSETKIVGNMYLIRHHFCSHYLKNKSCLALRTVELMLLDFFDQKSKNYIHWCNRDKVPDNIYLFHKLGKKYFH